MLCIYRSGQPVLISSAMHLRGWLLTCHARILQWGLEFQNRKTSMILSAPTKDVSPLASLLCQQCVVAASAQLDHWCFFQELFAKPSGPAEGQDA